MNILFEVQLILEKAGYQINQSEKFDEMLFFEDDCLLGFVSIHDNLNNILKTWEEMQDYFLKNNAPKLRNEPHKAWNAYSIFLTEERASPENKRKAFEVEEDLRGTRKILGDSINTVDELVRSLLPLLPIQKLVRLDLEQASTRLVKKLYHPQLLDDLSPDQLFNSVLEEKEE